MDEAEVCAKNEHCIVVRTMLKFTNLVNKLNSPGLLMYRTIGSLILNGTKEAMYTVCISRRRLSPISKKK